MSLELITQDAVRQTKAEVLAAIAALSSNANSGFKVQRGNVTPAGTAEIVVTITAVNPAKTMVNLLTLGLSVSGDTGGEFFYEAKLLSATQLGIKAYRRNGVQMVGMPVSWEVVECY